MARMSLQSWLAANQSYLRTHLSWLRMILQRRVLWLRCQWKHDPLQNYRGQVISDVQADWLLEGEDAVADQNFYQDDPGARKMTQAIEKAEEELQKQSHSLVKAGTPTSLDMLTQIFGLTFFDRAVLLLCLAPELDSTFERLYAYMQDDVNRKYATVHLALSLFATDPDSEQLLRQSFLPESPLFRFKLLDRENSTYMTFNQACRALRIDPRIADYLQGINRLDESVTDILIPVSQSELLPHTYEEILVKLQRFIEQNGGNSLLPVLNFTGPGISGKRDIASSLCETLGIELYNLNLKRLFSSDLKWHDVAPVLERECMLLPAALYIDTSSLENENDPIKPSLEEFIERLRVFFILSSPTPWSSERDLLFMNIPKLNAQEQSTLWKQQLERHGICLNGQIELMTEQFDFESAMITKAINAAVNKAVMRSEKAPNITFDDIWITCREQSRKALNNLTQRIIPCYTWQDIVLPEATFEQLQDIAAQVAHRAFVYETWGFGAKLNRGRGISALFAGPSGTGKTMAAEILANHLKLDLYRIDLSAVVSKYIGETEKNLRQVFDAAEQSGAILFFDEADALFGKRSEVKDSHDRYANIEINYLLQRMEDYRGLAILATNMKFLLDQAFLRRLRFHVDFPFPDANYRQKIWQKSFPSQASVAKLDSSFLARLEISGGNIKNIALNAAFMAAADGQVIEMNHIVRATKREYDKIGKMVLESEFGPYYERVKQ